MAYTRCLRCGRALKDRLSKQRGYGPECWIKVQHNQPPRGPPLKIKSSIENIFDAIYIKDQIRDRLQRAPVKTCSCGASLLAGELGTFDHDSGYRLRGFSFPQWVFITCPDCGLEWSYWKLRGPSLDDLCKHFKQTTLAETLGTLA